MSDGLEALLARSYEVVHHQSDCEGIGRGDEFCTCDAVPFLRDLEATFLGFRPTHNERVAIAELGRAQELSEGAVIRQALRLYQRDHYLRMAGEKCVWSGDEQRLREFVGPYFANEPRTESETLKRYREALELIEGDSYQSRSRLHCKHIARQALAEKP